MPSRLTAILASCVIVAVVLAFMLAVAVQAGLFAPAGHPQPKAAVTSWEALR